MLNYLNYPARFYPTFSSFIRQLCAVVLFCVVRPAGRIRRRFLPLLPTFSLLPPPLGLSSGSVENQQRPLASGILSGAPRGKTLSLSFFLGGLDRASPPRANMEGSLSPDAAPSRRRSTARRATARRATAPYARQSAPHPRRGGASTSQRIRNRNSRELVGVRFSSSPPPRTINGLRVPRPTSPARSVPIQHDGPSGHQVSVASGIDTSPVPAPPDKASGPGRDPPLRSFSYGESVLWLSSVEEYSAGSDSGGPSSPNSAPPPEASRPGRDPPLRLPSDEESAVWLSSIDEFLADSDTEGPSSPDSEASSLSSGLPARKRLCTYPRSGVPLWRGYPYRLLKWALL